jgi:hypothetical protein
VVEWTHQVEHLKSYALLGGSPEARESVDVTGLARDDRTDEEIWELWSEAAVRRERQPLWRECPDPRPQLCSVRITEHRLHDDDDQMRFLSNALR